MKNRESSFDMNTRTEKEHRQEGKRKVKPTTSKETFSPSKGGILHVDKAIWEAEH